MKNLVCIFVMLSVYEIETTEAQLKVVWYAYNLQV